MDMKPLYKAFAWIALILGCTVFLFEIYKFSQITNLIPNASSYGQEDAVITSSIGAIMSGSVGVIFSLCSVIFFVMALKSQRDDLKITQKLQEQQSFESFFFNLLKTQQSIRERTFLNSDKFIQPIPIRKHYVNAIEFSKLSSPENVKQDFQNLYNAYKADCAILKPGNLQLIHIANASISNWGDWDAMAKEVYNLDPKKLDSGENKSIIYKRFLNEFINVLGHYFRHMYHILKYIYEKEQDEIKTNPKETHQIHLYYLKYTDLLQAEMSRDELALTYYNGLIFDQAKFLYHYYNFLENLCVEDLIDSKDIQYYIDDVQSEVDNNTAPGISLKSRLN